MLIKNSTHIKTKWIVCIVVLAYVNGFTQVGINTTDPHPSSVLHIESTDKGILIPRLTDVEIGTIESPAQGLLVFNTDENAFNIYIDDTIKWQGLTGYMQPSVKYTNTDLAVGGSQTVPLLGNLVWNDVAGLYTINTEAHSITVNETGLYRIIVNAVFTIASNNSSTQSMHIEVNEVPVGITDYFAVTKFNGHDVASLHLVEVLSLNANDEIIIKTENQDADEDEAAPTLNLKSAGSSSIFIEQL